MTMTVLIAEDNLRMRESIRRAILSGLPNHHTIYEASDGGSAIELYERTQPDWVLMDVMMEPVDGLVASRAILAAHPQAKIIILTNYDDAGYRKAAKELGTRAFILKEHLGQIPILLSEQPYGNDAVR
jgi:DNA-binding NarL/FixJ family response regulator